MGKIQNALFTARQKRVAPAVDDKVLADWNGLMVAALAKAGNALNDAKYLKRHPRPLTSYLNTMHKGEVLYHCYAKGEAAIEGFLRRLRLRSLRAFAAL